AGLIPCGRLDGCGRERPCIRWAAGLDAVAICTVVPGPYRIEPAGLRDERHLPDLGPRDRALHLRELHTYQHPAIVGLILQVPRRWGWPRGRRSCPRSRASTPLPSPPRRGSPPGSVTGTMRTPAATAAAPLHR